MAAHKKYQALGRGLDALINTGENIHTEGSSSINEIDIEAIVPNPGQPRKEFDEMALDELALSIKQLGIVQPITLRLMDDGKYQIVAGERRWRASKKAGLQTIPAYIRTASDENMMQMALVENIQREDLNAIEVALAYQRLIEQYHLTQEELSDKVGKKRATIANSLRLLKLPAPIQMGLRNKTISQGHARAILGLQAAPEQQLKLYKEVLQKGYSVRQVEKMVRAMNERLQGEEEEEASTSQNVNDYSPLAHRLSNFFHTKVQMTCSKEGKGKITIPFGNEEQLLQIMSIFDELK